MFRPDLTEYEALAQVLADKLNEESLFVMSRTDAVKIALEKAVEKVAPDIVINRKRKSYQILEF